MKPGRVADYCTESEAQSVHAKQVVRQCRRLQALSRCLAKHSQGVPSQNLSDQITAIQRQIIDAKGFGTSYAQWSSTYSLPILGGAIFDLEAVNKHFAQVDVFAKQATGRFNKDRHEAWKGRLRQSFKDQEVAFQCMQTGFTPEVSQVTLREPLEVVHVRKHKKGPRVVRLVKEVHPPARILVALEGDCRTLRLPPGKPCEKGSVRLERWLTQRHPYRILRLLGPVLEPECR